MLLEASVQYTSSQPMQHRHSRLGVTLFLVYLAFYAGFVLLAAFSPETLERTPLAGVNLAIWYGFALIVAAFVLALIYGWARRTPQAPPGEPIRNSQSEIRNPQ
jgi:uncharacterized membrane protein (DUF485 family)